MTKTKGGLGKGLSALIRPSPGVNRAGQPAVPPTGGTVEGVIAHIEVAAIRPNPYQPRADFDAEALDELKRSIQQKGIIQPITVRRTQDGVYELISGERRIRACSELGLRTIPAYIVTVRSEEEMLELALIENLQREHLNPMEIAISYQRLMSEIGMSAEDVAGKVGKDRTTVVNFLRLLKLPAKIQLALRKNQVSMGHARALLGMPDENGQLRLFERIVKQDLNVRQVEKLVRNYGKNTGRKAVPLSKGTVSAIDALQERIQQILATRVTVHVHEGGRGEIVIEYYTADDLDRLFELISTIKS